jgi:hypothetical protein
VEDVDVHLVDVMVVEDLDLMVHLELMVDLQVAEDVLLAVVEEVLEPFY